MNFLGPFLFALVAAIGNAIFVAAQKKAVPFENPFAFIAMAVVVCAILTLSFAPFFGQPNYLNAIKLNGVWVVLCGAGLFITYIGFNLLYSKYGASNYILYAVLSIVTTSIIVGVIIFKESFNIYHWFSFITSIVTVILFAIGNNLTKT